MVLQDTYHSQDSEDVSKAYDTINGHFRVPEINDLELFTRKAYRDRQFGGRLWNE